LSKSSGQTQSPVEWFAGGIIDRERKLRVYLLASTNRPHLATAYPVVG